MRGSFLVAHRLSLAKQAQTPSALLPPLPHRKPAIRPFSITAAVMAGTRDPNTLSNYDAWRTRHTTATLTIDFKRRCLRGSVVLDLVSQTDAASKEILLDSSHVDVSSVKLNAAPARNWEIGAPQPPNGAPLRISLPDGVARGESVRLEMEVATTDKCTALQWLTPAQTSNKTAPFMFSQAQAIHARSLFPCQDTPDVKGTYDLFITSPHVTVASGVPVPEGGAEVGPAGQTYRFSQKVPMPTYLFAIASGDIVTAPIGRRSVVATAPDMLADAQWELQDSTDMFLVIAERIIFPYKWGEYNVLILPPSFPFGGMENPIFTFATPTIISADRQNVEVIAHELSHSWSGNLVTSCSWEHYWLNEGWTVYLQRRLIAEYYKNKSLFDFSAIIGWKELEEAVKRYGEDHPFTKLCISHKGIDPDDAFSTIPYEKGFHLVYYLDRLVGRDNFNKFIPYYFKKWETKSLDSYEFKDTFLEFFGAPEYAHLKDKIAAIDWEGRFYNTGLPPKPDFDTSLADACYELAEKWKDKDFSPSSTDIQGWSGGQTLVFLNTLQSSEEPLTPEQSQALSRAYGFQESKNAELKAAYYYVALRAQDSSAYQGVATLLGEVGRMKFVRPLFRGLNKVDRPLALQTFQKNRDFYHPICLQMVAKDLGVSEVKAAA